MEELRVIIAGGGTGGHIFPAIAVGQALQRLHPGTQLLFVGAKDKMEMEKVPQAGFRIIGLDITGYNRSNILKNITLPLKLLTSRIQARRIIREFRPGALVGVGGFASFPMLFAGQALGIPTLIQEQNSYAGKSNKILSRKARAICVAYPGMEQFFPAGRIILTGNPVRKTISSMSRTGAEGKAWFGLEAGIKTILVVGGSLGAKTMNESIDAGLNELMKENVQVIWQCGKPYYERAKARAAAFPRVKVFEFIAEMDNAYAAADVIISRAGALAIAEICIAAKPVIFVPYPFAAEDHQTSNAMALVNNKAAWLVADREVSTSLIPKIKTLLHDHDTQTTMQQNLRTMAIKDADEQIARKVMEIAGLDG